MYIYARFLHAGTYDPKKFSVADILRVAFLNNDAMLMDEENQVNGFITILDFRFDATPHSRMLQINE